MFLYFVNTEEFLHFSMIADLCILIWEMIDRKLLKKYYIVCLSYFSHHHIPILGPILQP